MPAREKLNAAHILGAAMIAGLIGGMADSWWVFVMTLMILLAGSLHAGDIRPSERRFRK
jgi:hypothetical protein